MERTMFCPRCGTDNTDDGRYCRKCGVGLEAIAQVISDDGRGDAALADSVADDAGLVAELARCRAKRLLELVRSGLLVLVALVAAASLSGIGHGGQMTTFLWLAIVGCVVVPMVLKAATWVATAADLRALESARRQALLEAAAARAISAEPSRARLGAEPRGGAAQTTRRMDMKETGER
jgi:hypothetical protein